MKRILFAVFGVIVMLPMASVAATPELNCTMVDGQCPAGCGYSEMTHDCEKCTEGTYGPGGIRECLNCSMPDSAAFIYGEEYQGMTTDTCPWTISCSTGFYFDDANLKCVECGQHYNAKDTTTCTISGTGENNITPPYDGKCTLADRCDGKVYKLILHSNGAPQIPDPQPLTKKGYFKYDGGGENTPGFAEDSTSSYWTTQLPGDLLYKNGPIYIFLGFFNKAPGVNQGANPYFSSNGRFNKNQSDLTDLLDKNNEINLYAGWQRNPYDIIYIYGNGETEQVYCGKDNKGCTTALGESATTAPAGQTFTGVYKCYINYEDEKNRQPCQTPEYKVGDPIAEPPNDAEKTRYFVAQYGACPAGHYCTNGDTQDCPAGTTSDPGAGSATNCYMVRGDGGTKFCDNTGDCFYLPGSGHVPHADAAGN